MNTLMGTLVSLNHCTCGMGFFFGLGWGINVCNNPPGKTSPCEACGFSKCIKINGVRDADLTIPALIFNDVRNAFGSIRSNGGNLNIKRQWKRKKAGKNQFSSRLSVALPTRLSLTRPISLLIQAPILDISSRSMPVCMPRLCSV